MVVFALSSSRLKMPGNPGTLGLGAVAATPATVLQVRCTGARFRAGRRVGVPRACAGEVGKAGAGAGGNVFSPCCMVLVMTTWQARVSACLSGSACLIICWGSLFSLSTWTCKRAT